MKNALEFLLENNEFQDTDSEATKVEVFDDITEDTAAVRVKVKEVDDPEEPDEGNISNDKKK